MQPAGGVGGAGGAHFFGDGSGESDYIMLHFALDFVNARDIEGGVLPQRLRCFARNLAGFRERLACGQFDFEPLQEAIFVGKDAAHFGARISGDQKTEYRSREAEVRSEEASDHAAAMRSRSASNSAEAFFAAPLNANQTSSSRKHVATAGQTLVKYR